MTIWKYSRQNKNISIPKPDNTLEGDAANGSDEVKKQEPINPENLTLKDAKKIIADSLKAYKEHQLDYVDDKGTTITITVKKGQYGPYFNYQGKNYSIYKTYDADNLTEEDVKKILSYKKKPDNKKTESKTRQESKIVKPSKITKPKKKEDAKAVKINKPKKKEDAKAVKINKPKKKKVIKKTE